LIVYIVIQKKHLL